MYIGMSLISHSIAKLKRLKNGQLVIYEGELVLRHNQTMNDIKIIIKSDESRKRPRVIGYVEELHLKVNGKFKKTDGYEVRCLIGK